MDVLIRLLPHLLNGVALGLLFALIALGFTLIVGVMEVINLAHGSLFALGAYLAMMLVSSGPETAGTLGAAWVGLPVALRYALALVVAPLLVAVVGIGLEICLRRTYGKKTHYGLLLTFGAALVIEESIRLVWGTGGAILPVPDAIIGRLHRRRHDLLDLSHLAAVFGAVAILMVWLFLDRTPYGAIIKAGAHDSEMVRALGINLSRLRLAGLRLRRRAGGARRHHHDADLGSATACRHRRGDTGLPDHRARRRRQLLGRGARRRSWSGSLSASPAPMPRTGRCCRCMSC